MEKTYNALIRIDFTWAFGAENKKEAVELLKEMFYEEYGIKIDLSFDYGVSAETYEQAVEYVKHMFLDQHNIELKDSEIDRESE